MRSNLAALCAAVATTAVGALALWTEHSLTTPDRGERVSVTQVDRSADLVAQLCARGADPGLCAQAGLSSPGARYVTAGPIPARWPQFADPANR